jgi:hypothetical protein
MIRSEWFAAAFVLVLFSGMLLCFEIGRRIGQRTASETAGKAGLGIVEGAIFALLGLLIAFTFSGAGERFVGRRHLIIEEANDIGTAYLRVDLLPSEMQPEMRELFRRYVDCRLAVYQDAGDQPLSRAHLAQCQDLQNEIWKKAVAGAKRADNTAVTMLLLPALNAMIDITTVRTAATENHPPLVIFAMLAVIALASSMMAGYEMAGATRRSWLHTVGFSLILSVSVYVILDLEYPRLGLIRVDRFDHYLVDVRNSMK